MFRIGDYGDWGLGVDISRFVQAEEDLNIYWMCDIH